MGRHRVATANASPVDMTDDSDTFAPCAIWLLLATSPS
jgi:hypothetical protein